MVSLNPDVYSYIIDQLHGDKVSLSNATLVSRSWLSPCQARLFSSLRIYGVIKEGFPFGPEAFLQFLEKNPEIAGYIQHLELLNQFLPGLEMSLIQTGQRLVQEMSLSRCFAIISKLPRLKDLVISRAEIGYTTFPLPPQLPSITSLHLHYLKFTDYAPISVWEILRPFTNLRALHMSHVWIPPHGTEQGGLESACPRLPIETLMLPSSWEGGLRGIPESMPLFIGLADRGCLQSTSTLEIGLNYERDNSLPIYDDTFDRVASQLNHLTLHATARGDENLWPRLNRCDHLRSIVYIMPYEFKSEFVRKPWDAVMDSLEALPLNPNLRSITIETSFSSFPFYMPSLGTSVDWDRFASIVGTCGAKIVLRFIDVAGCHPYSFFRPEWVHDLLISRLEGLFERGILRDEWTIAKRSATTP